MQLVSGGNILQTEEMEVQSPKVEAYLTHSRTMKEAAVTGEEYTSYVGPFNPLYRFHFCSEGEVKPLESFEQ